MDTVETSIENALSIMRRGSFRRLPVIDSSMRLAGLVSLWAVGTSRFRLLGVLSGLYALSYTAFQAFLGLVVLLFGFRGYARRRWEWRLLLYPFLGAGAGLLLHPHFPANLEVWALQNIAFFQSRATC